MSRRSRNKILYDGCIAHVYSRALEGRFIYRDNEDFVLFRKLLVKTRKQAGYRIHHYCLMNTHFHLLVSISNLKLFSVALKDIKQGYAKWFQDKYQHKGPVWWGRFGSQLIENEKYLYACGMYVEMNPVKAGMVSHPEDWEHSSRRHYFLGMEDKIVEDYERPSYELAATLMEGLNVEKGDYLGTPLFLLNHGRQKR